MNITYTIKHRWQLLIALLQTNVIKTIWFNFKMLPSRQAIKLPIFIYKNVHFRDLSGKIVVNNARYGMIKIGYSSHYVATSIPGSEWTIRGKLVLNGPTRFFQGTYLLISDNAALTCGGIYNMFGSGTKIICFNNIIIGKRVDVTWECQIIDTSFHYIGQQGEELDDIPPLAKEIVIGNYVWIGNRTTISKGAVIPDESIIASNSLVNKDLSGCGTNCLFAGMPAKVVKEGVRRIWNESDESVLDKKHDYYRVHL